MHPDLFMRIYQQQERELEQRLLHSLAARDRSPVASARGGLNLRMSHLRAHRRAPQG